MATITTPFEETPRSWTTADADLESVELRCPSVPSVIGPADGSTENPARVEALRWLGNQLAWERRLDELRAARIGAAERADQASTTA